MSAVGRPNRLHPIKAHEAILRLMRNGPVTLLKPKDMTDIVATYNLDDWCKPFTEPKGSLLLKDAAQRLGKRPASANLFVKPVGLRAWIELAKTQAGAWSHLCVYHGDPDAVETDVYGFCSIWDEIRLSRVAGGNGILCALLADSKEITNCSKYKVDGDNVIPKDGRTVLVLGKVGWA